MGDELTPEQLREQLERRAQFEREQHETEEFMKQQLQGGTVLDVLFGGGAQGGDLAAIAARRARQ